MAKNYHKKTKLERLLRDARTCQRYCAVDYHNARSTFANGPRSFDAAIMWQIEAARNSVRARSYLWQAISLTSNRKG